MRSNAGLGVLAVLALQILGFTFASEMPHSPVGGGDKEPVSLQNLTHFHIICEDICDSRKICLYPLFEEMLPDSTHRDCEAVLYTLDGVVLAHCSLNTDVRNFSSPSCAEKLLLKITCISPEYQYQALYSALTVVYSTASTSSGVGFSTSSGHLSMLLAFTSALMYV